MARPKASRSGFNAISEALVVLAVLGFFGVALAVGVGGNALSGLRDRVGSGSPAVAGVFTASTPTVSPTSTPVGTDPLQPFAIPIGTQVPVLATVDAIMTAHAERNPNGDPLLTTPTAVVEALASPTEAQATSLAPVASTMTPTLPSQTPTRLATSTPTSAPATATTASTETSTSTLDVSTATRTSTRVPTKIALTATGTPLPAVTATAIATPPPAATATAIATPAPAATAPATATVASTSAPVYAPPMLIGANVGSGAIVLSWSESVPLGPNDYFDVRVWQDGQPANGIANVQQPSYVVGGNFPAGNYNWTIAVIRKQGGQIQTLATAPTTLHFTWTPAGSSSGSGPPTR